MGPFYEKLIILVGMFVTTMVAAMLPLSLVSGSSRPTERRKKILSLCSCFSGGVFLGALFLDLFPDVREAWDQVLDRAETVYNFKTDYPVQGFVTCFGFFIVLVIEQILLEYKERNAQPVNREPIRRVNGYG